jgi:hypothetical protein
MFTAAKVEEIYCPRAKDFEYATDRGYSDKQILAMERTLLSVNCYLVNPTTLNMWANLFMAQWDAYCRLNPLQFEILSIDDMMEETEGSPDDHFRILFKSDDYEDYKRFR